MIVKFLCLFMIIFSSYHILSVWDRQDSNLQEVSTSYDQQVSGAQIPRLSAAFAFPVSFLLNTKSV